MSDRPTPETDAVVLKAFSPKWIDRLENAKMRDMADRRDWERNFSNRMSYKEYKIRLQLNAEVVLGYMSMSQAVETLKGYGFKPFAVEFLEKREETK